MNKCYTILKLARGHLIDSQLVHYYFNPIKKVTKNQNKTISAIIVVKTILDYQLTYILYSHLVIICTQYFSHFVFGMEIKLYDLNNKMEIR